MNQQLVWSKITLDFDLSLTTEFTWLNAIFLSRISYFKKLLGGSDKSNTVQSSKCRSVIPAAELLKLRRSFNKSVLFISVWHYYWHSSIKRNVIFLSNSRFNTVIWAELLCYINSGHIFKLLYIQLEYGTFWIKKTCFQALCCVSWSLQEKSLCILQHIGIGELESKNRSSGYLWS